MKGGVCGYHINPIIPDLTIPKDAAESQVSAPR